jgi:hypothetical protein
MLVNRTQVLNEDKSIGYIESIFNSGNVMKTTYFPAQNRLYIAFGRGDTYSYANIKPEFYQSFEDDDSQGQFFYKHINKNSNYPARKEFTLYPAEVKAIKEEINLIIEENEE